MFNMLTFKYIIGTLEYPKNSTYILRHDSQAVSPVRNIIVLWFGFYFFKIDCMLIKIMF